MLWPGALLESSSGATASVERLRPRRVEAHDGLELTLGSKPDRLILLAGALGG